MAAALACPRCGAPVPAGARFCTACGAGVSSLPAPMAARTGAPVSGPMYGPMLGEKNSFLALLLSAVTGLGQLYNGERAKGATLLIAGVVLFFASIVTTALFLVSVPLWIYGMYDAYSGANAYNHALRTTGRPPW